MDKSIKERVAEQREGMLHKMGPQAERLMYDNKLSGLRGLGTRRTLSLALLALCITMPWTQMFPLISIAAILGVFALWALLSRINRGFMDLPEELVDERIRARRNEIYRWSYILSVLFMFAFVGLTILKTGSGTTLTKTEPLHGFMGLTWTMFTLPTMMFAFLEKEI